jgi:alkyl hydroperoxide reductase subunit AhpF
MSDKLNKLKELKELLDAKAISEKEFQELKKQVFINDIIKESEVITVKPSSDNNLESSFPIKKNKVRNIFLIVGASLCFFILLFKQLAKTGSSPNSVDDYIERSNQNENSEENTKQTNFNAYDDDTLISDSI